MINISEVKYAYMSKQRKEKRDEIISLKRKLNTLASTPFTGTVSDPTSLFPSILNNSIQQYSRLASLSYQPSITSLLISEDQSQLLFHIINNLQSPDPTILQHTLTILGHISYNQKAQQLMNYDILPSLLPSLHHKKRLIRQLTIWILLNIAAQQQPYATSMLNNIELIDKLSDVLINDNNPKIKTEVLYLYRNLITNGEMNRVVEFLSDDDLFVGLKGTMGVEDQEFKGLVVEVLVEIVELGERIREGGKNVFRGKIEKFGLAGLMENEMGDTVMKVEE